MSLAIYDEVEKFLSTPSARRATSWYKPCARYSQISIHALREEGDLAEGYRGNPQHISIHALREEGDKLSRKLF